MNLLKRIITKSVIGAAIAAAPMVSLSSCDGAIYEDLDPCRSGIEVRFVYDYNMLFANAFYSQVDCLTLFVYDSDYKYVTTLTETTSALKDENYRMALKLDPGEYHLLAYGGMQCDKPSFHFSPIPGAGSEMNSLTVAMNTNCIGANPGVKLHSLYYGELAVTVPEPESNTYTTATLPMMCDTHNVRVLLQHVNGNPISSDDFDFAITGADNFMFDYANNILPLGQDTDVYPWVKGDENAKYDSYGNLIADDDADDDATVAPIAAFAEFSTSRLYANAPMRLEISNHASGEPVLSVPLIRCLLLLKSEKYASMPSQEYLDRESEWNVIFFLDSNNNWIDTKIVINGWVVRLNTTDLWN